jgi:Tfp pilus assembly protein PilX
MRLHTLRVDHSSVRSRLLRDESGIALIMALGIMLVLTIMLTSVIFLTASSARDAKRSNAGQQAYALAEAGINNALAVLNANYPGNVIFPGDSTLLPVRTNTYSSGSVDWSGSLVTAPASAQWTWEWRLKATSTAKNPTGPGTASIKRTLTAVVPVVIPNSTSVAPSSSALDWVYAKNDITFGQSVKVASPVYAGGNLTLAQTAKISEVIPASASGPSRLNKVAVGGNLSLPQPQNQIGSVESPVDALGAKLAEVHVVGTCSSKNHLAPHSPCDNGGPGSNDPIFSLINDTVIPAGYIAIPKITCCAPFAGTINPPEPVTVPPTPSFMGFWYQNASLGPMMPCATSSGSPPKFDTATGISDGSINGSAYTVGSPFNITAGSYTCKSGQGELSWDGTTLTVRGTIFIDGSITSGSNNAKYVGKGTIIVSGTFSMANGNVLCVNLSSGSCDTAAPWNPDTTSLGIIADGDFGDGTGDGIQIKKGQFQGLLLANKDIYAEPACGTLVQGPMVSVYGSVDFGQCGTLSFPAISFPSSGTDGLDGPLPLPALLPPVQFGG